MALAIACLVLAVASTAHAEDSQTHDMMKWGRETFVMSEVLEIAPMADDGGIRYDLVAWAGGAWNRIWAKAEGDQSTRSKQGSSELQLLYGRLISPFWDVQMGARLDLGYGNGDVNTRTSLAVGLQGLAPGWFEVEPTVFVSQKGDISGNLTASYDLLFAQRLVAQGRFETSAAVQDVPEFGVGSGIGSIELGLRLRYEIARQFAPYVGVSWQRLLTETADLARAAKLPVSDVALVAGLRLWI